MTDGSCMYGILFGAFGWVCGHLPGIGSRVARAFLRPGEPSSPRGGGPPRSLYGGQLQSSGYCSRREKRCGPGIFISSFGI